MGLISTPTRFVSQPGYPAPIDPAGSAKAAKMFFNAGGGLADVANSRVWTPNGSAKIIGTPVGAAYDFNGSASYLSYTGYADISGGIGTLALWFSRVGPASSFGHVFFGDSAVYFQINSSNQVIAWASTGSGTVNWFNTTNRSIVFTSSDGSGAGIKVYLDGIDTGITFSGSPGAFSSSSKSLTLGRYVGGSSWDVNGSLVTAIYLPNGVSALEAKNFHDFKGWHLLQSPPEEIWISAGTGATLATAEQAVASQSAGLTTQILLATNEAAVATATLGLSTQIKLSTAEAGLATLTATLSSVSSAALVTAEQAVASQIASLSTSARLSIFNYAQATFFGSLTTSTPATKSASTGTDFDFPSNQPIVDDKPANMVWLQWFQRVQSIILSVFQSGTTAQRPIKNLWVGRRFFDTTLNAPVFVTSVNPTVWSGCAVGVGQVWQNVAASRALGNVYTNNTSAPIMLSMRATSTAAASLQITFGSGAIIASVPAYTIGNIAWITTIVPINETYKATFDAGVGTIVSWYELR